MPNYGNENYDLLWSGVSGDHEAAQRRTAMVHAKVAVSQYWPFLSRAVSEGDFENRLSLTLDRIEAAVGAELLDEVLSSLRDDYRAVTAASSKDDEDDSDDDSSDDDSDSDKDDSKSDKSDDDKEDSDDADDSENPFGDDKEDEASDDDSKSSKSKSDDSDDDSDSKSKGFDHSKPDFLKGKKGSQDYASTMEPQQVAPAPAHNAYTPDPDAAWRYHPGYEQLRAPVNNGDSQGPDGFPVNLADGEGRSNTKIEENQLTPGTWSQHDGMPERPMPFSRERGYMPVNASLTFDAQGFVVEANKYIKQQGGKWVIVQKGTGDVLSHHDSESEAEASFRAMEMHKHEGSLRFDAQGFVIEAAEDYSPKVQEMRNFQDAAKQTCATCGGKLSPLGPGMKHQDSSKDSDHAFKTSSRVTATEGRGVDPLQDPAPGEPQRHNPFYFQPGSNVGGNAGFPVDPSNEPLPNNLDSLYGETPPVSSSGSTQGQTDGQGYSRLSSLQYDAQGYLVESPNFT